MKGERFITTLQNMKIKTIKIKNFRGYRDSTSINVKELTAFVGKNDSGKSTVLEALDIFFNDGKGIIKIESDDLNIGARDDGESNIEISVVFTDLPDSIIIDSTNKTTLRDEYLLNDEGDLEIVKIYPNGGKAKVYIRAMHPQNLECNDLHAKTNKDLKNILEKHEIECADKTKNATIRKAIWDHFSNDLSIADSMIDVSKGDVKSIWEQINKYMPFYSLFQSDRKNSDGDSEVQDPLKEAVKQILNTPNLKQQLDSIASEVYEKLKDVSTRTLEKIKEMNPNIANSLSPRIPSVEMLKWPEVFKGVSITSDNDIPINKRGSGVKRLILLNFFRAEAERRREESDKANIVYAIEEPETSQHTNHQKILIKALLELSQIPNTQILITTHSSNIVKELDFENIRLIKDDGNQRSITGVELGQLPYVSLNEIAFSAFEEVSPEYHDELYSHLGEMNLLKEYEDTQEKIEYIRDDKKKLNISKSKYIRHQIHHPENKENKRYTESELKDSIIAMRKFIMEKKTPIIDK